MAQHNTACKTFKVLIHVVSGTADGGTATAGSAALQRSMVAFTIGFHYNYHYTYQAQDFKLPSLPYHVGSGPYKC